MTLLLYREWSNPKWWDTTLTVLPSVLGFTLGGYAILISFGNDKFKSILGRAGAETGTSNLIAVSAAFMHFIVVQFLALTAALIARGTFFAINDLGLSDPSGILDTLGEWASGSAAVVAWFFGYWLFIYSLFTALAAAFSIFQLTQLFDWFLQQDEEQDEAASSSSSEPP